MKPMQILLATFLLLASREAYGQGQVVSAGDSYASGEGAPDESGPFAQHPIWRGDDTDGSASPCHRSAKAAPALAAAALGLTFASVACTGSVTGSGNSMTPPQQLLGPGGQIEKIASRFAGQTIDGLIVSIGGNDIGFGGIVTACAWPLDPLLGYCSADANVTASLAVEFVALTGRLDAVADAINGGMAGTVRHVFVTEYPDPTTGPFGTCGDLWDPAFQGFEGIADVEASWASLAVVSPLNAALAAAVERANSKNAGGSHPIWHFVSDVSARYRGHGYCTGGGSPNLWSWSTPRYINTPADSQTGQGDIEGAMHPNDLGQAASANAIASCLTFLTEFPRSDGLAPGDKLEVGQFIRSQDGRLTLILQGDGNLVLYGPNGALWSSNTWGQVASQLTMQDEGNLVLYGPSGALWDTGTFGHQCSWLVVQNDGNVVVYAPDWTPLWATGTSIPPVCQQTLCSGVCTDLAWDDHNCGACGYACPSGTTCSEGACTASCPVLSFDCCGDGMCRTARDCLKRRCL